MSFSADVSAGDTILASHYNNLRKDTVNTTSGHTHDGIDSRVIANLAITGGMLANDTVTGTKLADAVAGSGLSKDGSENLQVNVDNSTLEISSDSLQIKKATVGDNPIIFNDTDAFEVSTSYVKVKEILFARGGNFRIKFDLSTTTGRIAYGRIYKNGIAFGSEQSTSSDLMVTFSEDLSSIALNDLIQLYIKTNNASYPAKSRNFRVYAENAINFFNIQTS
jgi:hypothetical protein